MLTNLECKYSFGTDKNFSAYLNIDRETTTVLLINSIKVVFDFMKAILVDQEYENFNKGYLLRFLKSKMRNIKVIMDSFVKYVYHNNLNSYLQIRYDQLSKTFYKIEYFFKDLLVDIYKMEEEDKNEIYKGFCFQELSIVVYLSIQFFDLQLDIEKETFKIIDNLIENNNQ